MQFMQLIDQELGGKRIDCAAFLAQIASRKCFQVVLYGKVRLRYAQIDSPTRGCQRSHHRLHL
jgi:hypothetical protein